VYAGAPAGKAFLESAGISVRGYDGGNLSSNEVIVLGPGAGAALATHTSAIAEWLKSGGYLLSIGLDQNDVNALFQFKVTIKKSEHISSFFEPFGLNSLLAGIGPADVHNRDPRELPLISAGAQPVGDGVLARFENTNIVFFQMPPWEFQGEQSNLRRTFRRASFLLARLLSNMGVSGSTPLLERFERPVSGSEPKGRWNEGLYLDQPVEWDDPYRFFRW